MSARPMLLACEDEERIVELLRAIAEPLGVDFIAARDGATALAHLAARKPSMMTLDLVLRNLDGFAVLERIRQRRDLDDMPVMVVSGTCDPATIKRAYALGVVDFVAKPFNVDLLDAKLRVFLRMHRMRDDLERREQFLEQVVNQMSSGLIVVDAEGVIVKVNAAGAASVGHPAEALIGRPAALALPGADALFLVSGDALQRRLVVKTPAGERVLGFTNAAIDVRGQTGAVAVFRELSTVEAVRPGDERGREDHSQSAKNFAHEVRNPLAAIGAAAQVIARDSTERPHRQRLSRAIESEANRITRLVREYIERGHEPALVEEADVAALLTDIVEVNLLGSPARERIHIDCQSGLPKVRADADRLKQVVLNLVLNAVHATEEGGAITLGAAADARGVALKVSDTGCGIADGDLPRIFEESFSTRRGGGLGLPIARRIVEAHGGSIRVESATGQGTTFTVWLPSA
ncbi:MAG TPA: ATP-binding protein [Polyangia bacterium]